MSDFTLVNYKLMAAIKALNFDEPTRLLRWGVLLLLFAAGPVRAEPEGEVDFFTDFTIEELLNIQVDVVTKSSEDSRLIPAVMTLITEADIDNYGYETLAEVLSHVAGVVDNYDQAIHNFGIRGVNSGVRSGSRTIKIMLNGHAVAFHATSQHFIDHEFLPIELVKRVEIIRGPISALYGANAFMAVVNVVTKDSAEIQAEGNQIKLQNSNHGYGHANGVSGMLGQQVGQWSYLVAAKIRNESKGRLPLPKRSPANGFLDNDFSNHYESKPKSLYAELDYSFSNESRLKLSSHYQEINTGNPFSDINPLPDFGTSQIALSNWNVRADYQYSVNDDLEANLFIAHSQGDTLNDDKIEVGAEEFSLDRRFGFSGVVFGGELIWTLDSDSNLLFGADYKEFKHRIETFTRVDRASYAKAALNPPRDEDINNKGVFVQYSSQLTPTLRGIVGARLDEDSVTGSQLSSRIGFVAELPKDFVLKLLYGSSFQAPSPELLYRTAVQAGDIIGNPNLKEQKATTKELSVTRPIAEHTHLSVTLFETQVDDLVIFKSIGNNLIAQNSSDITTRGLEFEMRMLWQGFDGYFNFGYQNINHEPDFSTLFTLEQRPNGELHPRKHANLGLSYNWKEFKTRLALNSRWLDKRAASTSNVLYANQLYDLDDYMETSLTLATTRWSLIETRSAELRLKITDVFDHRPVAPGFSGVDFPSLGRQFHFSIEQRF